MYRSSKSSPQTPISRRKKMDSLGQGGSIVKYCEIPKKNPLGSYKIPKMSAEGTGHQAAAAAAAAAGSFRSVFASEGSKDADSDRCASSQARKKRISHFVPKQLSAVVGSPVKRATKKEVVLCPETPDVSLFSIDCLKKQQHHKSKKEIIACPDSPGINFDILGALKRKTNDVALPETASPKKRLKDRGNNEPLTVKRKLSDDCLDGAVAASSSSSLLACIDLDLSLSQSQTPKKKSKICENDARFGGPICPELPEMSSKYEKIVSRIKRDKCEQEPIQSGQFKAPAKDINRQQQQQHQAETLICLDDTPVKKDVDCAYKHVRLTPPADNNRSNKTVKKEAAKGGLSRIIRQSSRNFEQKDLLSITSSKIGRTCSILPDETRAAASLAFGQQLGDLQSYAGVKSWAQICPDFRTAVGNQRDVLNNSFNSNFGFHLRLNQDAMAVRLLRIRVSRHSYPNGKHIHEIMNKIIPVYNCYVTLNFQIFSNLSNFMKFPIFLNSPNFH